uniref:Uncharacterized protein n=1 Tax=Candidatus Kentrum sp. LPFa TaxID=2126335 RepID=A0A450WKU1_9GAMM|nr:MAG: hypothetical protein BECKLPF1236B_GA0070989_11222 [Candidatus Kentron sp. LPFa]
MFRDLGLYVTGGVEDQWHDDNPSSPVRGGAVCGAIQTFFQQNIGEFDEADLNIETRLAGAPLSGESLDLSVAIGTTGRATE